MDKRYREYLDEIYDGDIFGHLPSYVLEKIDEIQFSCGFDDFQNMVYDEVRIDYDLK
jgi:hypothetical protein